MGWGGKQVQVRNENAAIKTVKLKVRNLFTRGPFGSQSLCALNAAAGSSVIFQIFKLGQNFVNKFTASYCTEQ